VVARTADKALLKQGGHDTGVGPVGVGLDVEKHRAFRSREAVPVSRVPAPCVSFLKSWRGLSVDEVAAVVEKHFVVHAHRYNSTAGEQFFGLLQDDIRKALREKQISRATISGTLPAPPPTKMRRGLSGARRKITDAGQRALDGYACHQCAFRR
jgi:hypothetical protein